RNEAIFYAVFAASFLLKKRHPWILMIWAVSPLALALSPLDGSFAAIVASPVNLEFAAGFVVGAAWHISTGSLSYRAPLPAPVLLGLLVIGFFAVGWWLDLYAMSLQRTCISAVLCSSIIFVAVHILTG